MFDFFHSCLDICISSFEKCLFIFPFINWIICCFIKLLVLYIFWVFIPWQISSCKDFLTFCRLCSLYWFLFILHNSFWEQYSLICSVLLLLFYFLFRKSVSMHTSSSVFSVFSSSDFKVSGFTLSFFDPLWVDFCSR
jgi:hypothetical protein